MPLALVDRAAAVLARAAVVDRHAELFAELGEAAGDRLRADLPGARWEAEDPCPGCGMGRITPSSRRFLRLFAKRS